MPYPDIMTVRPAATTLPAPESWRLVAAFLVAALLLCLPRPSASAEYLVDPAGGASFSTISGAMDAAPAGSIIRLRPGVYTEMVSVDKDVVIVGIDPASPAIIDGEGRRPVMMVAPDVTCRFENLTLRNGVADEGAACRVAAGAVVDFINCGFHDNAAASGGAVLLAGARTWSEFIGCHFQHNRARGDGGAIAIRDDADVTLRACTFFANHADGEAGAVDGRSRTALAVEDCLFIENAGFGSGALLATEGMIRVAGNTFFRNTSLDGATVVLRGDDPGLLEVTNNIFAGDVEGAGLGAPAGAIRGCNLYSANLGGALMTGDLAGDELSTDPGFCDFRMLDLTLSRMSPAAGRESECGRIGALDVGCLESLSAALDRPAPRRRVH